MNRTSCVYGSHTLSADVVPRKGTTTMPVVAQLVRALTLDKRVRGHRFKSCLWQTKPLENSMEEAKRIRRLKVLTEQRQL